jgi:hypothetical protein
LKTDEVKEEVEKDEVPPEIDEIDEINEINASLLAISKK